MNGYFLHGSEGEKLMVIRGRDEDVMKKIINVLSRSRDETIKELAEVLENHFNDRNDDGRSSIKAGSKDKKDGGFRR